MAGHGDGFVLLYLDLEISIPGSCVIKIMDFRFGMEDISQNWEIIISPGVSWINNHLSMELEKRMNKGKEECNQVNL